MLKKLQASASALFDGGWRSKDKEQLIQEYNLTEDEVDILCKELEKYVELVV